MLNLGGAANSRGFERLLNAADGISRRRTAIHVSLVTLTPKGISLVDPVELIDDTRSSPVRAFPRYELLPW